MMEDLVRQYCTYYLRLQRLAEEDLDMLNDNLKRIAVKFDGVSYDDEQIDQKLENEDVFSIVAFNRLYDAETEIGSGSVCAM